MPPPHHHLFPILGVKNQQGRKPGSHHQTPAPSAGHLGLKLRQTPAQLNCTPFSSLSRNAWLRQRVGELPSKVVAKSMNMVVQISREIQKTDSAKMATDSSTEKEEDGKLIGGVPQLTVRRRFARDGKNAAWSVSSSKPVRRIRTPRRQSRNLLQSEGVQPHLVNVQFQKKVRLQLVVMYVDFKQDESYTPSKITIRAGDGFHNLKDIKTVEPFEADWLGLYFHCPGNEPSGETSAVDTASFRKIQRLSNVDFERLEQSGRVVQSADAVELSGDSGFERRAAGLRRLGSCADEVGARYQVGDAGRWGVGLRVGGGGGEEDGDNDREAHRGYWLVVI
ncbi:unnamed protein product [Rhodiola kirilowii]